MVDNNLGSLDPFGQLSLDPFSSNNAQQQPHAGGNNPATPPRGEAPKSKNMSMTMTTGEDVPGMNADYQYGQQQQQPMQVSPENHTNNHLVQHQQPDSQQQQQQAAYANHQFNSFHQQPQMQHQQQQQYPIQQQRQYPAQAKGGGGAMTMPAQALSPPISPLWTPASPDHTPPSDDGAMPGGTMTMMQQGPQNGMAPSLPTGFGAPAAPGQGGMAPVPTLSPCASPVQNPFDAFAAPAVAASATAAADPFADNSGAAAPLGPQVGEQNQPDDDADFWNDMGFGNAAAAPAVPDDPNLNQQGNVTPTQSEKSFSSVTSTNSDAYNNANQDGSPDDSAAVPVTLDERGLPEGGSYYNARVTTPMLGAIFSSGRELRSTLYKTASASFVEAIGDRPVISFTIDGSAADTAGIGLGHVLLEVNGESVKHTDEAVKTVGIAARPMTMEFYVPSKEVRVVKTEGQCMVKYDNHKTEAPASPCEWKPKYVVVGDMLGKPHILYMYRSKAEYDIAVKESQTRNRALSVKVKQFDIRGAKIFHERGSVQYPNKPRWYYFTVVRGQGPPIKISTSAPEALQPLYDGITTFLDREAQRKDARMEERRREQAMAMGTQGAHNYGRETYY
eukprot:CAMPEP_0181101538 /NCGR_PEP_ID=MMETSP1071-20121207/13811_1 /TAXON_ID=35127 /ORGANISM="Thalassiosira sp., Strain NH16" /LENGTH=616 /DNA_ID=CAMNT_0023184403 /DNA_START=99 /DNA_END=1949 /DNA_ORIENTATION=-